MSPPEQYEIDGLGLSGSRYVVEQTGTDGNFQPEYEARDAAGETVFRCTHRMYEKRDRFPVVDADGTELCTVEASGTWDVAGDYLLTDARTGDELVVLDNDLSLVRDTWRIRDATDGSVVARISSRGALYTLGRKVLPVGQFVGHSFEVTDPDGHAVGTIESGFAVFDQYELTIRDRSSVPVDPVLVSAVVIDAIQGN